MDPLGLWGLQFGNVNIGIGDPTLVFFHRASGPGGFAAGLAQGSAGVADSLTLSLTRSVRAGYGETLGLDLNAVTQTAGYQTGKTAGKVALLSGGAAVALNAAAAQGTLTAATKLSVSGAKWGMGIGATLGGGVTALTGGDAREVAGGAFGGMVAGGLFGLGSSWVVAGADASLSLGVAHGALMGGSTSMIGNYANQVVSRGYDTISINQQLNSGLIGMGTGAMTGGTSWAHLRARAFFETAKTSSHAYIRKVAETITRGWEQNMRASEQLVGSGATGLYGQSASSLYQSWMGAFQQTYRQGLASAQVAVNPASERAAYWWLTTVLYPLLDNSANAAVNAPQGSQ